MQKLAELDRSFLPPNEASFYEYDGKPEQDSNWFGSGPSTLDKVVPQGLKTEKFELDVNKHVAKATGINRYVF